MGIQVIWKDAVHKIKIFGKKSRKDSSDCAQLVVSWCIWSERSARIIRQQNQLILLWWDKIIFVASLWVKADGFYEGMSLFVSQVICLG